MHNRIKELRDAKGWSMRELAARVNTSASTINKLEKGETTLNILWMERLGKAFGVSPEDLLRAKTGFQEDVSHYEPGPEDKLNVSLSDLQFPYRVATNVLDQIGIMPGDILVADVSPEEANGLSSGDVVIAQIYHDTGATTVLRQFIEPSLLITNSSGENLPTINLRTEDAAIKAVVVSSHAQRRQRGSAR